jgi:hypothetical protein
MPVASTPAPILIQEGWEDGLTNGASQATRLADYVRQVAPAARVLLQLGDVGHGITSNKPADTVALDEQATDFFDHFLKGDSTPAPPAVTAYTSICPASTPSAGPFTAPSWAALHPGTVRFGGGAPQLVASGGDPTIGLQIDPVMQPYEGTHCNPFRVTNVPGTAVYTRPVTKAFTMLGLPTLRMHISALGNGGQLDARLWDVAPNGQEQFVSRGTYALTGGQRGTITWQLFGGGYTFPAGDTIRLELLNSDTPYLEPSENAAPVTVSDVTVELPSHDPPDGNEIVSRTFEPASS